jgi:hypothetical protein
VQRLKEIIERNPQALKNAEAQLVGRGIVERRQYDVKIEMARQSGGQEAAMIPNQIGQHQYTN